ncbi:MAG: hypothetical protein ABIG66_00720 [Candidatus Kerfeldbacteria bacterium]
MKYVIGVIMIAFGVFVIWKTESMIRMMGKISWAEDKFGSGGTWTFWKVVGLALILLAFFIMSGAAFGILDWIFARG